MKVNPLDMLYICNAFPMGKAISFFYGDCLEKMKSFIYDGSIDLCLTDPPYGTTSCKWDSIIPFEPMWEQLKRVMKKNAAIVLFAQGGYTVKLISSNMRNWRYNLIWDKQRTTGFLLANKMPLRCHEDICVFYRSSPIYNPQMQKCAKENRNHGRGNLANRKNTSCYNKHTEIPTNVRDVKYPRSIISIPKEHSDFYHPTQKPVALLEYLIKTYTNEGDTVLDFTMGSGSTAVACINTRRNFIGIEKDKKYYDVAVNRIQPLLTDQFFLY